MATLRSKCNRPLRIELKEGKAIKLLARGIAEIDDEDISSPSLKRCIDRGDIIVLKTALPTKEEQGGKQAEEQEGKQAEEHAEHENVE